MGGDRTGSLCGLSPPPDDGQLMLDKRLDRALQFQREQNGHEEETPRLFDRVKLDESRLQRQKKKNKPVDARGNRRGNQPIERLADKRKKQNYEKLTNVSHRRTNYICTEALERPSVKSLLREINGKFVARRRNYKTSRQNSKDVKVPS